ncbi:MAG: T9SS type A sorting domain-containing protein [Bacteroidota bacterium]
MKTLFHIFFVCNLFFLATIKLLAQNPPVALPDYASTRSGLMVKIPAIQNDYDPDGDSIFIQSVGGNNGIYSKDKNYIYYTPYNNFIGIDSFLYKLYDWPSWNYSWGKVYVNVADGHSWDSVDVSNINAAVNSDGMLFFDYNSAGHFYAPKGGAQVTIFSSMLNIGGLDSDDSLHYVGHSYANTQAGFYPGPTSNVYDSAYTDKFYRTWKVTKAEIEYHKTHWWTWGYVAPEAMQKWPAHGEISLGQAANLAPFYDFDSDGIYESNHGDYPIIRGDEALLFLFSDGQDTLSYSKGEKLGIDVIGMLYAYDCPLDSALWNSIFLNYKIYNRSAETYTKTFVGFWSDMDIGYSDDNFMGCDVERSTYYGYNGDDIDGNGSPFSYGAFPPVQSVTILKGPFMDADGSDNPSGIDEGINGFGYGDGTTDNECLGLTNYVQPSGYGMFSPIPNIFNSSALLSYMIMQSYWQDSTMLYYGGEGWYNDTLAYGPNTRYHFPGNSDTLHWGTNYQSPNGIDYWSEDTAHLGPYVRRGVGSMGPFTFTPGEMKEIDLALVFARNFNDPDNRAAIPVMQQRVDSLRKYFVNDYTPCSGSFFNTPKHEEINSEFHVFPNPATDQLVFEITNAENNSVVTITDLFGNKIMSNNLNNKMSGSFDISGLSRGIYLISILNGNKYLSKKFVKL